MSRIPRMKLPVLIILLTFGLLATACSPSTEKLNREGNDQFAEQAYLEALHAYQSAQIESPELAEPYYNAANALYREGAYTVALEQMQQALRFADDDSLAENSFFNLGNTLFSSQELETAVEAYKQALLLDPDDQDAKYNLELALQQQQQQQQEQQQEQQEQQQEENQENQDQSGEGENQENEQESENDGSQGSENQENQNQESEQSENGDQENNQDSNNEQGKGQNDENQPDEQQPQPGQTPAPGQRMTEEQAKQLLAAIAQNMETLQERLGQFMFVQDLPPIQDW